MRDPDFKDAVDIARGKGCGFLLAATRTKGEKSIVGWILHRTRIQEFSDPEREADRAKDYAVSEMEARYGEQVRVLTKIAVEYGGQDAIEAIDGELGASEARPMLEAKEQG